MGLTGSRYDSGRAWINVAIVGQTRVGEGIFINAIRGIGSKTVDSANVTHGMKPGDIMKTQLFIFMILLVLVMLSMTNII